MPPTLTYDSYIFASYVFLWNWRFSLHTVSYITVAATRVRALPSTEALLSVI